MNAEIARCLPAAISAVYDHIRSIFSRFLVSLGKHANSADLCFMAGQLRSILLLGCAA
jgi:hypothetical protein